MYAPDKSIQLINIYLLIVLIDRLAEIRHKISYPD